MSDAQGGSSAAENLRRTRSRELRGGVLVLGCKCNKRNGLQEECFMCSRVSFYFLNFFKPDKLRKNFFEQPKRNKNDQSQKEDILTHNYSEQQQVIYQPAPVEMTPSKMQTAGN